jgi:hypothetical protein
MSGLRWVFLVRRHRSGGIGISTKARLVWSIADRSRIGLRSDSPSVRNGGSSGCGSTADGDRHGLLVTFGWLLRPCGASWFDSGYHT